MQDKRGYAARNSFSSIVIFNNMFVITMDKFNKNFNANRYFRDFSYDVAKIMIISRKIRKQIFEKCEL